MEFICKEKWKWLVTFFFEYIIMNVSSVNVIMSSHSLALTDRNVQVLDIINMDRVLGFSLPCLIISIINIVTDKPE